MFKIISEGNIFVNKDSATSGSRTAMLSDGKIICSFMTNSAQGINDFIPWISYSDDGEAWSKPVCPWNEIIGKKSVFGSVRRTLDGRICFAGVATPITAPKQAFWSDEAGGMLENKLVYSISEDGYTFPELTEVDLPYYASAENPGGMLIDEAGNIMILYSPYPTIEKKSSTDTCCMVILRSEDGGKTFVPYTVGEKTAPCQYAEAWLVKLTNSLHFISTWQTAPCDTPDQYLISKDGAKTFTAPLPLPFSGQSTSCEPYYDGEVLVIYNQRREEPRGVWLALGAPDEHSFNMIANEAIWRAESATRNGTDGEFSNWTDFAFGEPHVTLLPDGKLLATLWYESGETKGVRFIKLEIDRSQPNITK